MAKPTRQPRRHLASTPTKAWALYLAPRVQDGWLLATHNQRPCHGDHPLCGTHSSHAKSLHPETKSMRWSRKERRKPITD